RKGAEPAGTTSTRIPYTTHRNSLHRSRIPMSSIEERVKKIVVEQLGVKEDEVSASASFVDDLGADSLDTVELVMALEEEFECEIPDEEAEKITSVQQAIDYVKTHVKACLAKRRTAPQRVQNPGPLMRPRAFPARRSAACTTVQQLP